MPSYDYHCKGCDRPFVIEAAMTDSRDGVVCPRCTSADVYRQFGRIGTLGGAQPVAAGPAGGHAGGCCGGHCH